MPSKELLPSSTTSDFDNTHFQTLSAQVLLVKVGSHLSDGIVQEESTQSLVMTFIVAYIMLVILGTVVYTLFGCDLITGVTASISCISNVGPGFGEIGSMDNFSELPVVLKLNSTLLMLIGRLEIFGFIQLLFIRSWR